MSTGWQNIRKITFIFSENIEILFVSETHFTNKSYYRISGYTLYHTMHLDGKAHGGTARVIRYYTL
jgi:hypothetical protein